MIQEFTSHSESAFCPSKTDGTIGDDAKLKKYEISTLTWFKSETSLNMLTPDSLALLPKASGSHDVSV